MSDNLPPYPVQQVFLSVVNEGADYEHRCELARLPMADRPVEWSRYAHDKARHYADTFGEPMLSPDMVLLLAYELATYYDRHVKEL